MPPTRRGSVSRRGSLSKRRGSKASLDANAPTIISTSQSDGVSIPIPVLADSGAAVHDTVGALEPESKRVLESHGNPEGEALGDGEAGPNLEIGLNSCERYVHENNTVGAAEVFAGGYVHIRHGIGALAVKNGIQEASCCAS